jgi:hypothetical protein
MLHRSTVKNSPGKVRLGDDVTKENRDLITRLLEYDSVMSAWYLITRLLKHDSVTSAWYLITRLLEHDSVTSAWYFNGSDYGSVKGKRVKFDILYDIDLKVRKIRDKNFIRHLFHI